LIVSNLMVKHTLHESISTLLLLLINIVHRHIQTADALVSILTC
jgi:hypothetical protein